MGRARTVGLLLILALVLAAAAVAINGRQPAASARQQFASGGLGLTLDEWTAIHGEGEVGQSARYWPVADGTLWVAPYRDTGVIGTVERLWDEPGVTLEEALAEAERLMPEDARLVDVYHVPSARILHEDDVYRYTSELLRDRFGGEAADLRSSFVVIVEQRPLSSSFASRVTYLALAVGRKP